MTESFALIRYDAACRAIAEAKTVDEAREFHDEFKARQAYARQAKNRVLEADCVDIRFRATRRIDQLVKAQAEIIGLAKGGWASRGVSETPQDKPTLAEAGIDKNLAKQARALGRLDEEAFEKTIEERKQAILRADHTVIRARTIEQERQPYQNQIADGCLVDDLFALAASGVRVSAIYADPPWKFEAYSGKGKQRAADRHYDTEPLGKIMEMGNAVQAVAADNCALFLWCVMPELPGALDVIESWGFAYKTAAFVWIKTASAGQPATGMGYWTRANAELCLLATRGSPSRLAKDVHQVVMAPRGEHSAKPDEVRQRIMRLVGGPYLELYGRGSAPGWYVWGNQIPRSDFMRAAE